MLKKIVINILFILLWTSLYADFSDINSLKLNVREKTKYESRTKIKEYSLIIKFPYKIFKKISFPELNKGEIYIYKKDYKIVYIPLLDQYEKYDLADDENQVFSTIKDIKNIKKNNINYTTDKNGNVNEIIYNSNSKIKLEDYKKYNDFYFPNKMIVIENEAVLSELSFSNVKINPRINDTIFNINN